eukprot:2125968-Prymnesium_polylepis.1
MTHAARRARCAAPARRPWSRQPRPPPCSSPAPTASPTAVPALFRRERSTNSAALALGQRSRARCPHLPRARTRRPYGQRA